MPSLSSFDKPGCVGWEDKDLEADFESGCDAMSDFLSGFINVKGYKPKLVFTMGNHENRLKRAREHPDNRSWRN